MRFRKPEIFPLLFTLAAVLVLGGLGVWQVQRLVWKEQLLASIQQAQELPPLLELPQQADGLYRNIELRGTYLYDKTFHLVGQMQDEGVGFFLLTPLKLDDGRLVLVNRGWSPVGAESKPAGEQTVRGIIRPLREKRLFAPANRPDKNIWFYEDMPAMSASAGAGLPPFVVEALGKRVRGVYPIPNDGQIRLRNDHFGYAITWFALALIALVMFACYHRVPKPPS